MEDLLATVRARYGRAMSFRGLTTLVLRRRSVTGAGENALVVRQRHGSLLDVLEPGLNLVSRQLRVEMERLLESREKAALQTVNRDMRKLTERQAGEWRSETARTERMRQETLRRAEKRVDLLVADTSLRLRAVSREVERLKAQEQARQRAAPTRPEDRPLTHRAAHRLTQESARRESERTRRQIADATRKTERRMLQKMRDEAAYNRRRTG